MNTAVSEADAVLETGGGPELETEVVTEPETETNTEAELPTENQEVVEQGEYEKEVNSGNDSSGTDN